MNKLLYEKIYHFIKEQIDTGVLKIGDRLPTENALAEKFQVSRITSKRALSELEKEGLITRTRGKGSFVKKTNQMSNKSILLLLPFQSTLELGNYAKGIMTEISKLNYRLIVQLSSSVSIEELSDYQGIIYYPEDVQHSLNFLFHCDMNKIPVVLLDKTLDMFSFSAVVSDNMGGSYALTKHLLSEKCDEILFVGKESFAEVSSVRDRYLGYLKALKEGNQTVKYWSKNNEDSLEDYILSLINYILLHPSQKTGLVVENDWLAVQLLQKMIHLGISVPNQVAIVGFDNIESSRLLSPALTTAAQDFYKMGKIAANILLDIINNRKENSGLHQVPVEIFIRESSSSIEQKNENKEER